MKNNKKITQIIGSCALALCICSICSTDGGSEGRGNLPIPGGGSGGGSNGFTHKLVWTHYSFNSETGKEGQSIWLVPQYIGNDGTAYDSSGKAYAYSNTDNYAYTGKVPVSGDCASAGVGFWALTLSTNGSKEAKSYNDPNLGSFNGQYRNETQLTYLTSNKTWPSYGDSTGTYMSGSTYVVYRNAHYSNPNEGEEYGYSPYHTVSYNNSDGTIGITYGPIVNNDQTLYYYDGSRMYSMYTSDRIAGSESEIIEDYKKFYKRKNGVELSDSKVFSTMGGASDGTYYFCSYGGSLTEPVIRSKTYIEIKGTTTRAESDWDSASTNNNVYETSSPTIYLNTKFTYDRDITDSTTNFGRHQTVAGDSSMQNAASTGSFDIGVAEIYSQHSNKAYTLAEANREYSICSETSIDDSGTKSKACIKVKYVPVVADVVSQTHLSVDGVSHASGEDNDGVFDTGSVDYGTNALTAVWGYSLKSNARCAETNFNGWSCKANDTSITDSFVVKYKRSGNVHDDSSDQSTTLSSTGYTSSLNSETKVNSKTYNLLPGEPLSEKQGISHLTGVHTDGEAAKNATTESSSMTLKATAKNAVCDINDLEFGLNNPVNYGRMVIYKSGSPYYYGNGKNSKGEAVWDTNGPLYFRPDEELQISYDACLGQQIKVDKDSGKSWDEEWTTNNAKLTVGITDNLLDSSHFESTGNAVSTDSAGGRNILAYEVLGKKISSHVSNDYQFDSKYSNRDQIGNLGHSIESNFGDLSGCPEGGSNCKANAVLNVPYNYILTPSINEFTESIVTIGDSFEFKASINNSRRINEDVQSEAYSTEIKKTWAKYLTFKLNTDVDYDKLNTVANNIATLDNNQTDNLSSILKANLGGSSIVDMGSGEFTDNEIKKGATKRIPVNAANTDVDYNKLCIAVAVYPADSHNSRNDTIRAGTDQSNALTDGPGTNAFTHIAVSCRTVGKYPTFSTEGNGILSGGKVSGKYTRYNERDFGSWSEYGLIADEVDMVASGASIAYIDAQSGINAGAGYDRAGKEKSQLYSPQTLGNMNKDEIGLRDSTEASVYANQMTEFANNIKSTFFTDPMPAGDQFLVEYPGTHTWVNLNYKDDVWIGEAQAAEINNRRLAGDQVIIYSDNDIMIENKVTNLDAMLVANGNVDTCYRVDDSGNKIDVDQGGDNSQLLNYCHDSLIVNGVVYSKEAIELDRTYGGGSETDLNLRDDTLVKRAEIFNFDPRTVKWGYDYDNGNQPLVTTYIEELSTRY